ncbi:MAG: RHS repeat-associated core domain-containing protein [Pirellulaceae bacterium]|nr:RHS repeat-associated core domain-containing protein [Pirellulaceae bacterium]
MILDNDYDQLNRVKSVYHWDDANHDGNRDQSEIRAEFAYTLRADGKRTAAIEHFWRETGSTSTELVTQNEFDWSYDAVDRLISETLSHNSVQEYQQYWQYDLSGNRTIQTKGSESTTYSYDANDRLTLSTKSDNSTAIETETYTYNKTQQATKVSVTPNITTSQSFTYTLQGSLGSVATTKDFGGQNTTSTIVYEYDSTGTRVASVLTENSGVTRTEYLTDSQNPTGYSQVIEETVLNATGQLIKRTSYSIGHDQISQAVEEWVEVDADDNPAHWDYATHYFGTDGHGSVRVLYDAFATIARDRLLLQQLYSYDAYGNLLNWTGRPATVYLYSGEAFDFAIGQQYLRARFYDPHTGRFTGLDPFFGNSSDPQSFHKYAYVHGDPVNGVDPSGEFLVGFLLSSARATAALGVYSSIGGALAGMGIYSYYFESNPLVGAIVGGQIGFALSTAYSFGGGGKNGLKNLSETVLKAGVAGFASWAGQAIVKLGDHHPWPTNKQVQVFVEAFASSAWSQQFGYYLKEEAKLGNIQELEALAEISAIFGFATSTAFTFTELPKLLSGETTWQNAAIDAITKGWITTVTTPAFDRALGPIPEPARTAIKTFLATGYSSLLKTLKEISQPINRNGDD